MKQTEKKIPRMKYPVLYIEEKQGNPYAGYLVVRRPSAFTSFGRVPNSMTFQRGRVFSSNGMIVRYEGSSGWPRFSPKVCAVLDNLLLPGLVTKLVEFFVYFGPNLRTGEEVTIDEFRDALVASIERFRGNSEPGLRKLLAAKGSYFEVIEGVHWWQFNSGSRDPDGHPEESEEYNA